MRISDLEGNSRDVREKIIRIDDEVSIIITKWSPNGTKWTKFYCAFEVTTGHCVMCCERTREKVIETVKTKLHIIKRKLPETVELGGLFE
jgi:Cu/Ag efflux pump CusA